MTKTQVDSNSFAWQEDLDDYTWQTEQPLSDNTIVMSDYLDNHMDRLWQILYVDGTYAEVLTEQWHLYELHASGDGDDVHHKISFVSVPSTAIEGIRKIFNRQSSLLNERNRTIDELVTNFSDFLDRVEAADGDGVAIECEREYLAQFDEGDWHE